MNTDPAAAGVVVCSRSDHRKKDDQHDKHAQVDASKRSSSGNENEHGSATAEHQQEEQEERWDEHMHRQLVEAIYDIGVAHSSPSILIENMTLACSAAGAPDGGGGGGDDKTTTTGPITSERVKSHLQKYRKNKHKSKEEFLHEYDEWMQKALTVGGGGGMMAAAARTSLVRTAPPAAAAAVMERVVRATKGGQTHAALLGGTLPAFLSYSIMLEEEHAQIKRRGGGGGGAAALLSFAPSAAVSPSASSTKLQFPLSTAAAAATGNPLSMMMMMMMTAHNNDGFPATAPTMPSASDYTQHFSGTRIPIPVLSEEERQSSIGVSMNHVVGLFHALTHHLVKERGDTTTCTSQSEPPAE